MQTRLSKTISFLLILTLLFMPVQISYAESATSPPKADDIIVTNNAGTTDTVFVMGLYDKETVKVYNAATGGRMMGTATATASKSEVTIRITQLGKTAGSVYVTLTTKGQAESVRVKADFTAEVQTEALSPDNIIITNNAGKADVVNVVGLYGGETIKVYSAASSGKLLATYNVASNKTEAVITMTQLGTLSGSIYVTVTNKGELESERVKADFTMEPKSDRLAEEDVSVANNAGISDTIRVNYLSLGDVVKVYDAPKGGNLLGSSTVAYGKTEVTIVVQQLSKSQGSIYLSLSSKGKLEGDRVKIDYPAENFSNGILISSITVANQSGLADTLTVTNLTAGDEIKVYDALKDGNLMASGIVANGQTQVVITLPELGDANGSLYLSRASKGKFESPRIKVDYTSEPSSEGVSSDQVTVTNNAGKADTVVVSELAAGDIVKVYSDAAGGSLLGTATVASNNTQATVSISQLGSAAGSVYITVTTKGRTESGRIRAYYTAESVSDGLLEGNITVTNNPSGKADVVHVTGLNAGDVIKVYNAATAGSLLGSGKVSSSGTEVDVSITQLGTEAGSIYLSVTSADRNESSRIKADYSAETKSDGLDKDDITVTNLVAGTADTILVTGLNPNDVVKVYDSASGGTCLGTSTVKTGETYVILTVQQLGCSEGSVYVTVTSPNKIESDRVKADYTAETVTSAVNKDYVTIANKSGAPDTIEVTNLNEGDIIKVYDSAIAGKLLGTATVETYGTYATVTVTQLGTGSGSVFITLTSVGKLESPRTKVDFNSEAKSGTVDSGNIVIINNAGAADMIQVTGLKSEDQVKVYTAPKGGSLLGSATAADEKVATINITQLGSNAGSVYLSILSKNQLESDRIKADYNAEEKSGNVSAEDVTVSNQVGTSDIIRVSGLSGEDTIRVYDSGLAGNLLGTASATTYATSVEISVTQLGSEKGSLFITRTSKNKLESDRVKVDYTDEQQSLAPIEDLVTVINNAGMSDTIRINGLKGNDVVKVYDSSKAGTVLGTGTVETYGSSVTITVTQLGNAAGSVYLSVTGTARLESNRTKVDYEAEPKSEAPSALNILVDNNAGIADTVKVSGLSGEETISVYNTAAGGTLLGSVSVPVFNDSGTVNVTQLGTGQGKVYVTITKKGCQESDRTAIEYLSEAKSAQMDTRNIIVSNNAGVADTVQINCLTGGDVVNVYNAATGGTLLGTSTVTTYNTYTTLTITQLGGSAGKIYIAIKNAGKLESNRVAVAFDAEQTSGQPLTGNIEVNNHAGIADILHVTFLESQDVVRVYDSITGGKLLGTATESDGSGEVYVTINQLGVAAGKVYVSVTSQNKLESERTQVDYLEEETTGAIDNGNVTIINRAKTADNITATFLNPYDLVKVYSSSSGGTLLGSAMVEEGSTEVTFNINQLGSSAGSVYVSVTGYGKKESLRTRVDFTAEQKSDSPAASNILVRNNAQMTDTLTATFLDEGDLVKIYDSASGGSLLGSGTVAEDETEVTIKVSQLGSSSGRVYLSVTSSGKLESSRTPVDYTGEATSDAPDALSVTITNNSGKSDTLNVIGLTEGDIVKVYNQPTGGSLLGSATVSSEGSEVTIKVTQLGTSAGNVYISVTSKGAFESDRTKVSYNAET